MWNFPCELHFWSASSNTKKTKNGCVQQPFSCYIRPSVMRVENFQGLVTWNDDVCLTGSESESYSVSDLSKYKTYTEPFPLPSSMCSLQTDLSKFTLIALTLLFTEQNNEHSFGSSPQFDSSEIKDQRVRFHYEAISSASCTKNRLAFIFFPYLRCHRRAKNVRMHA